MTQPTTGYTSDEITAVVQQLVLSAITTPIDTLGVRRSDLTFNQFQQTAAGLFVLYPNAPFYVLWLGVQRVRDQVTAEAALLTQLQAAIAATGMIVSPVSDVTPLFDAQSALQNLAAAAASRTSAYGKVSTAPAYQQFSTSVSTFLNGPGQNVKSNGQIVQTPQQAKAAIPGLLTQIKTAHAALVASVTLIFEGIDNYNSVSLPAIVSESVLSAASALVGSSATLLSSLSPTDRLTEVRQVVLNLIASKTAVDTFGTINQPSDYYMLTGVGMPYSDAQHLTTPALAVGDVTGAMNIITSVSDFLLLVLDGTTTVPLTLPPSVLAHLDGQGSDLSFFVVDGSGTTLANNTLKLAVTNSGVTMQYACALTLSTGTPPAGARTADQIAADINAALPGGLNVQAEGYYVPLKYSGSLIVSSIGGTATWTVPSYGGLFIANLFALGVKAGDTVQYGSSFFVITTVDPLGTYLRTSTASSFGPSISAPTGSVAVMVGAVNRKLRIYCSDAASNLAELTTIQVYADDTASTGCLQMLGYTSGMAMTCAPSTPDTVANYINANTKLVTAGTYVSSLYVGAGRSNPTDATSLTITEAETLGSQAPQGTGIMYTVSSVTVGGAVSVGDTLVCRSGSSPGSYFTVDSINADTTASDHTLAPGDVVLGTLGAGSPAVGTAAPSIDAEFGPALGPAIGDTFTISAPDANQGLYVLTSLGATPLDVNITPALSFPVSGAAASTFQLSYGKRSLTLASENTTTTSEVYAAGNAAGLFFGVATPVEATATASSTSFLSTTLTFTVGTAPTGAVSVGDSLNTTNTSSGMSACYVIQSINGDVTATDHALVAGDILIAVGTVGAPIAATASFTKSFMQLGTTPWFQLPSIPNGLQAGDVMEVYPTQYNSPSVSYDIAQVIPGINVIEISPEIADGVTWTFTPQPVPFARLRVGIVNDYTAVQALMQAWLNNGVNQPLFFTNLNAVMNPLLTNDTPTPAQLGTAKNAVNSLWAFLQASVATSLNQAPSQAIDTILADYDVEPVSVVDTLLTSYTNQGADRAVDILLSGDFATFFGLSMDGASYSGAMQEATRAVAQNDLPVSKVNRAEQQSGQIQSTAVTADPEYPVNLAAETVGSGAPETPGTYGQPTSYLNK